MKKLDHALQYLDKKHHAAFDRYRAYGESHSMPQSSFFGGDRTMFIVKSAEYTAGMRDAVCGPDFNGTPDEKRELYDEFIHALAAALGRLAYEDLGA